MLEYNVQLSGKTLLVTGAAGFIGSNLVKRILRDVREVKVVGLDSMNDYYDVNIKRERLTEIETLAREMQSRGVTWTFVQGNLADKALIDRLFAEYPFAVVVNLAAQAGVRYSITNPQAYIESNLIGFYNILEACRHSASVEHLVYASSSSVYGSNKKVPYSTDDKVDNPVSLYAATKKSNELLAHAYSKLYDIPSASPTSCDGARPSRYSTMGTASATSPSWTISSRAYCVSCSMRRRNRPARTDSPCRPTRYII